MIADVLPALLGFSSLATARLFQELQERAGASAICTNSNGTYNLSSIAAPVQGAGSPGSENTWNLAVDDTSSGHKQSVTGFGAAVTDATVTVFNSLSSSNLSSLLKEISHFSLMRHTIASSDLSGDPAYTYDDNGGNADPNLTGFGLGARGNATASLLAKMKSMNSKLQILGSPWSAPGWMKLNDEIDGSTNNNSLNDGYLTNNGAQYSSQFAQYFVKYISNFNSAGANITAITIQNEPLNSQAGYPTMYMYDYEQANLVKYYVGPALKNAKLGTAIWAYDHNTDQPSYPQTVINNGGGYVNTVAWHCYANPLNWTVLNNFHNTNPNVTQYMSECYTSPDTPWDWVANFTMGPLQNWASGAMAWTLGTTPQYGPHLSSGGCGDCVGLVTVSNGAYNLNVNYYMMAQFSKYIPQGATILNGTGSYSYADQTGIQSVASLNPDGTRTVVIWNKFSNDVYVTSSMKSGQKWSGNVPKNSVVTWLLPSA
ncbi:Glycoside hydrolase, family 30 [Lecanosticta acicola]|uniref:glucan endo-1,6-beta-glucosidase n=1 Tax=Lecanosticta acicola TaxID=111012 RepID=A0AAI9EBX5_9PEZI|nr:Glycoside hydrolase, family 30 [Lecanosticta acicola]